MKSLIENHWIEINGKEYCERSHVESLIKEYCENKLKEQESKPVRSAEEILNKYENEWVLKDPRTSRKPYLIAAMEEYRNQPQEKREPDGYINLGQTVVSKLTYDSYPHENKANYKPFIYI